MWKELAKHAGGVALAWVVVLVGTFFMLRLYSQPSAQRQVPDLSGMARMDAFDTLATLGLEGVWQDSIYLPTGTPGAVVEQHPPAGSAVKVGRNILLTTHRITPPDEAVSYQEGQDAKLVERILTTRGFRISMEEEPNQLLVGKVIRLEHKGKVLDSETRLPKGSELGSRGRGAGLGRGPRAVALGTVPARCRFGAGPAEARFGARGLRARRADRPRFSQRRGGQPRHCAFGNPLRGGRHRGRFVF